MAVVDFADPKEKKKNEDRSVHDILHRSKSFNAIQDAEDEDTYDGLGGDNTGDVDVRIFLLWLLALSCVYFYLAA